MKTSMFLRWLEARVAQLAERRIRNAKVGSSILPAGLKPSLYIGAAFFISWGELPPLLIRLIPGVCPSSWLGVLFYESDRSFFGRLRQHFGRLHA